MGRGASNPKRVGHRPAGNVCRSARPRAALAAGCWRGGSRAIACARRSLAAARGGIAGADSPQPRALGPHCARSSVSDRERFGADRERTLERSGANSRRDRGRSRAVGGRGPERATCAAAASPAHAPGVAERARARALAPARPSDLDVGRRRTRGGARRRRVGCRDHSGGRTPEWQGPLVRAPRPGGRALRCERGEQASRGLDRGGRQGSPAAHTGHDRAGRRRAPDRALVPRSRQRRLPGARGARRSSGALGSALGLALGRRSRGQRSRHRRAGRRSGGDGAALRGQPGARGARAALHRARTHAVGAGAARAGR